MFRTHLPIALLVPAVFGVGLVMDQQMGTRSASDSSPGLSPVETGFDVSRGGVLLAPFPAMEDSATLQSQEARPATSAGTERPLPCEPAVDPSLEPPLDPANPVSPVELGDEELESSEEPYRVLQRAEEATTPELRRAIALVAASGEARAYDALMDAYASTQDQAARSDILTELESFPVHEPMDLARLYESSSDPNARRRIESLAARQAWSGVAGESPFAPASPAAGESTLFHLLEVSDAATRQPMAEAALGSSSPEERRRGMELLRHSVDEETLRILENILFGGDEFEIRLGALESLAQMRGGEEAVRRALAEDDSEQIRSSAARALAGSGTELAAPALSAAVLGDPSVEVRKAAAESSATIASDAEELTRALEIALTNDPVEGVRARAGRSLAASLLLGGHGVGEESAWIEEELRTMVQGGRDAEARNLAQAGLLLLARGRRTP